MCKTITLISAASLALATVTWSTSTPIQADDHESTVRMYFKIPLGGENDKSLLERSEYGFQYSRDLDFANFGTDHFNDEKPIVDMKFNFSDNTLKSANVFGFDAGVAYGVLTGEPIYRAHGGEHTTQYNLDTYFGLVITLILLGWFAINRFDNECFTTNAEGKPIKC